MRYSVLNAAAVAAVAFTGLASAVNMTEWKSRSIYQVMIDRYARTDGSTDHECEAHLFCGGTWAGLIKKLDYIQDLGFTAVQISPIVKNIDDHTAVGDAYHGYWSVDNYALNDKFGTKEDFKALTDELKKRDILLMVDVVVNNMVQAFDNVIPPKVDFSKFNPFNDEKYFHPYCNVTDWEDPTGKGYQDCWLYPYGVALADLDTRRPDVVKEFSGWIKDLVSNYSIDGLRIDAAKHVNDEFLPVFSKAAGVFTIGEVLSGVIEDQCRYQTLNLLEGMPNYLEYYKLIDAFNGGQMTVLDEFRNKVRSGCPDVFALGSFIENHDMPRFASLNEDMAIAQNVMAYLLMTDGIPTVYQGQEQHFKGNGTPFNREPLWQSNYDQTSPLYVLTATLNKLRNHVIKRSSDFVESTSESIFADNNHLCFGKGPSGSKIVTCINNMSSGAGSKDLMLKGFEPDETVIEVVGCTHTTADATGTFNSYNYGGSPRVYVSKSAIEGAGICPETTEAAPIKSSASVKGAASGLLLAAAVGWAALFLA